MCGDWGKRNYPVFKKYYSVYKTKCVFHIITKMIMVNDMLNKATVYIINIIIKELLHD